MIVLPSPKLLFQRWQCLSVMERLVLGTDSASRFFTFTRDVSRNLYHGEINDFAHGYSNISGLPAGPAVWCGGSSLDPEYDSHARLLENRARDHLMAVFGDAAYVVPIRVPDSMGWSFAYYIRSGDKLWADATGSDPKRNKFTYLEDAIALGGSAEEAADYVIQQYGVKHGSRGSIVRFLEMQQLSRADVAAVATGVSIDTANQIIAELE